MIKLNRVTMELLFLTALCAVATVGAFITLQERRALLLLLTGLMALITSIAQFRHSREVRTLKGARGRRMRRG